MDKRFEKGMHIMKRERLIADNSSGGRSKVYRMLPLGDGDKHTNRVIILAWRPAVVCPEIFGKFYDEDYWDFKAAVRGHWVSREGEGGTSFFYCSPGTTAYYEKLFPEKKFEKENCRFCDVEKPGLRYFFQVFDYEKLIGEKALEEGEERPGIQIMSAPQTVFNQLWNKLNIGYEFWDKYVTAITRDTKKGLLHADYIVDIEPKIPEELEDERLATYLADESNYINPFPDVIRFYEKEDEGKIESKEGLKEKVNSESSIGIEKRELGEKRERKIRW